jgi:hypothetical protein
MSLGFPRPTSDSVQADNRDAGFVGQPERAVVAHGCPCGEIAGMGPQRTSVLLTVT